MARSGGTLGWAMTKAVAGLALFALAGLLVHLCLHSRVASPLVFAADAAVLFGLPIALTSMLLRALRRIDRDSTFLNTLPGLIGLWCVIILVALPWAGRAWVSRVLIETPHSERDMPPFLTRALAAVGQRLAPPPPAAPHGSTVPVRAPAGVSDAGIAIPVHATDASASRDAATPTIVATFDASVAAIDAGRVTNEDDAGTELSRSLAIDISVCASARAVVAVNLAQGSPDELVVTCDDGVRVFWLQGPALFLRTLVTFVVPSPLEVVVGDAWIADLDDDGHRDLALCAYYATSRGGTRGGKNWWARGRETGQFGTPAGLDNGECAAVTTGDVTGDGHDELFVLREGNPWQPLNPNGSLFWFSRNGARWQMRGNFPLFPYPLRAWVADGNGDGIGDLFVTGDNDAITWFAGSPRGLQRTDAGVPGVTPPERSTPLGDFDGDGRPDRIEYSSGGTVRIYTTTPRDAVIRSFTHALDFVEYPVVGR